MDAFVILKAVIALPFLFFIPGYVTFHAFKVNRIENLKLSIFETLFLQILASIAITGWVALILAEVGHFSLWVLIGILLAYSAILAFIFKVKFRPSVFPKPKLNLESALLTLIIVVAIAFFFHPSGYVVRGTMDDYFYTGVNLAKTESLIVHDPFQGYPQPIMENIQPFREFTPTDGNISELLPSGLHLYPTWIAIFYSVFGLQASLYVTPLFALLGVLGIYLLGTRLFNSKVGLISACLLGLNLAQIYWSRTLMPEILVQFLILAGAYAFLLFRKSGHSFFSVLSAVSIGELLLTKLELIFIIIPIIFYVGFVEYKHKLKSYVTFLIPLGLLFIHSIIHDFTISQPYVFRLVTSESYELFKIVPGLFNTLFQQNFTLDIDWYRDFLAQPTTSFLRVYILIGILVLFAVFILMLDKARRVTNTLKNKKFTCILRHVSVLLLIAFVIYNYFVRPQYFQPPLGEDLFFYRVHWVGFDAINMIRLGYFLTPLGLWLGIMALLSLFYKKGNPGIWFFFLPALFYFIILTINSMISPPLPWWSRKFTPIVIPMFTILIAYAIYTIRIRLPRGKTIAVLLVLFLIVSSLVTSAPLIGHKGKIDAINQLENLANSFTEDDIIIFHPDMAGIRFASPLRFIFSKKAVMLKDLDAEEFEEMLKERDNGAGKIFFIHWKERGLIDKLSDRDHVEVIFNGTTSVSYSTLVHTYLDLNIKSKDMVFNLHIHEARYKE